MKLSTSRLASHVLTLIVLLALGVLVFYRSGLVHQIGRNAPGRAAASAQQTSATERPFRAEGIALVDATWPIGPDSVVVRPSKMSDSGATVEPTGRVMSIDGHATELGAFQGILNATVLADCRVGALTIHDRDGNSIRLILKFDARPAHSGTYRVLGGTGKFERATGEGSYRDASTAAKQRETVSITMEGTICY